jgi:MFS family permease
MTPASKLLSRDFVLLWLSSLLGFGSFFLLLTVLPLYALELGGRESEVGLVLGVFALSAMCLRPFVGRQLDRRGRVPLLALGGLVFALASAGYGLVGSIAGLLALRAFHGIGMALGATAGPVLAGDLAPPGRRGEAIGVHGSAQNVASALGPPLGAGLALTLGHPPLFVGAAAAAAAAALCATRIREPLRPAVEAAAPRRNPLLASALVPGVLALGLHVAYGTLASFVPVRALRVGLENPGLYFLAFALSMIAGQTVGGRLSDRLGRGAVIVPGLLLLAAGTALVGYLEGTLLLGSGVIAGLGQGAAQPALLALAVDRVGPGERGAALGTVGTFVELGIGGGSILAGLLAERLGLEAAFAIIALAPLSSAALTLWLVRGQVDAH